MKVLCFMRVLDILAAIPKLAKVDELTCDIRMCVSLTPHHIHTSNISPHSQLSYLTTPTSHLNTPHLSPYRIHNSNLTHLTTSPPHTPYYIPTSHTSPHPHLSHLTTLTSYTSHLSHLTTLTQLDFSIISQKNVGSFDVSMHLVLGMKVL